MTRRLRFGLFMALLVAASGCGPGESGAEDSAANPELVIFAAASLEDAVREVGAVFSTRRGVAMVYNFAASGALAQQLMAASRADIFISASNRWMDAVEASGSVVPGSRRAVIGNALSVIVNPLADYPLLGPQDFCTPKFAHLSIGDPAFVPAGEYARDWLRTVSCGSNESAWQRVEGRVSPAPDARAAVAQVEGSSNVAGVVFRTDSAAAGGQVVVTYEVPTAEGPNIVYSAARCEGREENTGQARAFLEFLDGEMARRVFTRRGFISPHGETGMDAR
jgi:molybdate transport system substrate-binding protein